MIRGDVPALFVYPPDELSDEAIYAISEFLHEICRSFEDYYYARINRHADQREQEERERVYTSYHCELKEGEEPF